MDIKKIIENKQMNHVYQSMWRLENWRINSYEALIRFPNQTVNNIEEIFNMARDQGCLYKLDTLSIRGAIKKFPTSLFKKSSLFINLYSSTLIHPEFEVFLQGLLMEFPHIQGRVIFELNETLEEEWVWRTPDILKRIEMIKKNHLFFALDDIGKGANIFQKIIEFTPHYIKLDRYFSVELSESKEKQEMLALLVNYCHPHIGLVLEGIEKEVDLAWAKILNVPIVQGYLLGKPEMIDLGIERKKVI